MPIISQGNPKIVVGFDITGSKSDGLTVRRNRITQFSFFPSRDAEIVMGFGIAGPKDNRLAEQSDSLIPFSFIHQGDPEIAVGFRQVRPESDGPAMGVDGLIQLPLIFQDIAKIAVSACIIRFEDDGLAKRGNRLIKFPFARQQNAETVVGFSVTWPQGNRPADQIRRNVVSSRVECDQSQMVHCNRMLRLLDQHLLVKLLRFAEPPRLVVSQCLIENLLNRELGHIAGGQYPT